MAASGFYVDTVIGRLRAAGQIEHWDRNSINPSGYRHHESGQYKAFAKLGLIGGFTAQKESGVAINFGQLVVPDNSGFMTDTVPITFNLGEVNSHPSSFFNKMVDDKNVGVDFKAFNMRFWQGTLVAFSGLPTPTFYFRNSAEWRQGYMLQPLTSSGTLMSGVQVVPSSMPDCDPNVLAKSPDSIFVSGNFIEKEISHFLYVRGIFPSGNHILGIYGGLGEKTFTFRFSYDWTIKDANVLSTDTCDIVNFTPANIPFAFLGEGISGHYRLNEHSPRQSAVSGFPGVSMTLVEFSGAPGAQVNNSVPFGSGIVASGHPVSGLAARFTGNVHLQTQTTDCATLNFAHNSSDGLVSFCIAGWVNFNNMTQDQGILGRWHDTNLEARHQYRLWFNNTTKRFHFELQSRNQFEAILRYHIFNKYLGTPLANRWYFFIIGYDKSKNEMFMRINDLPIDRRQITDLDKGLIATSAGNPFALGCANTRSVTGTPTRMNGLLDSVTIFRNYIPSNKEMDELYNGGKGIDFVFPSLRSFDFDEPPIEPSNPDAGLKESLTAHFSLNRPSGSTTWPDDAGPRVLTATFKTSGTIGATSGIIDNIRVVGPSGSAVCARPLGSGWLQADSNATLKMEPEHPFTISAWVRLHHMSLNHGIVGVWRDIGANNRHYLLRFASSRFGFQMANGSAIGAPSELQSPQDLIIESNKWYNIIIRYDPNVSINQLDMTINNEFRSKLNTTFVFNTTAPTEPFVIGAYNTASTTPTFSDIDVDAVTVWRRKITDNEIKVIYNDGDGVEWKVL